MKNKWRTSCYFSVLTYPWGRPWGHAITQVGNHWLKAYDVKVVCTSRVVQKFVRETEHITFKVNPNVIIRLKSPFRFHFHDFMAMSNMCRSLLLLCSQFDVCFIVFYPLSVQFETVDLSKSFFFNIELNLSTMQFIVSKSLQSDV